MHLLLCQPIVRISRPRQRQDPDGSLLENHEVPERLQGLVPTMPGENAEGNIVPGSFKCLGTTHMYRCTCM